MQSNGKTLTYLAALTTLFIWGTTFVSTKILIGCGLTPAEILVARYVAAYALFLVICPKPLRTHSVREELSFAACGVLTAIYFIFENTAIMYSTASNVSLLVTASPMFTGLLAHFFTKDEKISRRFVVGCLFGIVGVFLIVCNGHFILHLNPLGDFLAVTAALSFAFYSLIIKSIDSSYTPLQITRRTFFYALLSFAVLIFTPAYHWKPQVLFEPKIAANLLFLGVGASALCYLLWNKVIRSLGAVRANGMIYLIPAVTMVFAAIILRERITLLALVGGLLILCGVCISQNGGDKN